MKFTTEKDKVAFYEMCNSQCTDLTNPNPCSDKFVDCTKFGGYDPADKCKQTCVIKEDSRDF